MTPPLGHFVDNANCIETTEGSFFDLIHPRSEEVSLEAIASGLSKICRFGGQTKGDLFYSVAEHSVLCWQIALSRGYGSMTRRAVLLHDAHEAYTGDITRPLKQHLPEYVVISNRVQDAIYQRYGVRTPDHASIKGIDDPILREEAEAVMTSKARHWNWSPDLSRPDVTIGCWDHKTAKQLFLLACRAEGLRDD